MHPHSMRRVEEGPLRQPSAEAQVPPLMAVDWPGRSTISDLTGFRPFRASRLRRGSAQRSRRPSPIARAIWPSLGQYPGGPRPVPQHARPLFAEGGRSFRTRKPARDCLSPSLRSRRHNTNHRERVMPNRPATWCRFSMRRVLCFDLHPASATGLPRRGVCSQLQIEALPHSQFLTRNAAACA
jgi:hypothetical protein